MTVASASGNKVEVIISEEGQRGLPGIDGTDGSGFNSVRKSLIDNPLLHVLKKNKLEDTISGSLSWVRSTVGTYIDIYGVLKPAGVDTPREEVNGWLIEGESTNLLTQSNTFNVTPWVLASGAALSQDGTLGPDNSTQAWIVDNTGSSSEGIRNSVLVTDTGQDITMSWFVKAKTSTTAQLRWVSFGGTTQDYTSIFDLVTGEFTAVNPSVRVSSERLANGWFRLSVSAAMNNTGNTMCRLDISPPPSDLGDLYSSNAQIEELSFSSSYIDTSVSQVTRTSDVVTVNGLGNVPSIKEGVEISVFAKVSVSKNESDVDRGVFFGSGVSFLQTRINANSSVYSTYRAANGLPSSLDIEGGKFISMTVDSANNLTTYEGGSLIASSISAPVSEGDVTQLILGRGQGGITYLFGNILDFRVYDSEFTSEEIEFLAGV